MSNAEYGLSIAVNAKPFPLGPLAIAAYINTCEAYVKSPPIDIKPLPVENIHPDSSDSSFQLVRKSDGTTVTSAPELANVLSQRYLKAGISTKGSHSSDSTVLSYIEKIYSKDKSQIAEGLKKMESIMQFSMHPLGVKFTAADFLFWGAIKENPQIFSEVSAGKYPGIERWYKGYMDLLPFISKVTTKQKELTAKPKTKSAPKTAGFKLPDAEVGHVVTRFPPEPSGYLHIGHAKAAICNAIAATDYEGTLIVRFDDTNPSKESVEFQESQLADLHTIGVNPDKVTFTSNYFDQIEEKCIQMLKEGKAYCDDTPQEQMRKERMDGIASKNRDTPPEENLRRFQEMKNYSPEGQTYCVRAKISVDSKNKALRDPVIYRCNPTPHHRTGSRYKIYPTYDFACPIVDSMEGVTHALRTLEYKDRDAQYAWMLKALGMRNVKVVGFSRLNFVRTVLSKRKLQWFVDNGYVSGWDDPRFPTVRGMSDFGPADEGVMRRGCVVEALRKFIISQGPSKNINNLEWASFWAENKKVIDPIAKRYTSINADDRVPVELVGGEGVPASPEIRMLPCHKKNPALGEKQVYYAKNLFVEQDDARTFKDGEEITLMDWGNAIIQEIKKDGESVVGIKAILNLQGDFKKTDKKITWIADVPESLTPCILTTFDHLITKDKLEENDNVADYVNHNSVSKVNAIGDINLKTMPVGSIIQFERKGYFRLDRAYDPETRAPGEFFLIPDGKTVNRYGAKA